MQHAWEKSVYRVSVKKNLKEREHRKSGVDGKIILKWISDK
jgi:hypothetical protein